MLSIIIDTQSFHVIDMKSQSFFVRRLWQETKQSDFKINFSDFFFLGKYTSQPTNSRLAKTKNLSETPKFTFTETLITVFFKLPTHHCPVNIQLFLDQCVHPEIALKQVSALIHSVTVFRYTGLLPS